MHGEKNIFISYSWQNQDIVDIIDTDFQHIGIVLIRDKRAIDFKQSIKDYMRSIRKTDYVVMIISDQFLKSRNCLFEVMEFIKDEDYRKRILPIICSNADIFQPEGRAIYIKYWDDKYNKLRTQFDNLSIASNSGLEQDLMHYDNIRKNIGNFIITLSDIKTMTFEELKNENYETILLYINHEESRLLAELIKIRSIKNKDVQEIESENFIKKHPDYFLGYFSRGYIEFHRGEWEKSLASFNEAIKLMPLNGISFYNRAIVYSAMGKGAEAIEDYNTAIKLLPEYVESYVNLGIEFSKTEKYNIALEEFSKAIEIKPDFAKAYFDRGYLLFALEIYESAYKDFTTVLFYDPANMYSYYYRGQILYKWNRITEAFKDMQASYGLGNKNAVKILEEWEKAQSQNKSK